MRGPLYALCALLSTGCWQFDQLLKERCADGGLVGCPVTPDAGTDGGLPALDDGGCPVEARRSTGAQGFCWNGFSWENPTPQGNALNAVWGAGPNDVWVAGDIGALMHWDGTSFTSHQGEVPVLYDWQGLWGDGQQVWLVGSANPYVPPDTQPPQRFDGQRWTAEQWQDPAMFSSLQAVSGDDAGAVVAVGEGGAVVTRSMGKWSVSTRTAPDGGNLTGVGVTFDAPGSCWAAMAGVQPSFIARCDGGFELELEVSTPTAMTVSATGEVWVSGYNDDGGLLLKRSPTDGGWTVPYIGGNGLGAVTPENDSVLAVGLGGQVVSGTPPTDERFFNGANLRAAWSTSPRTQAWAVGEHGEIRWYQGSDWQRFTRGEQFDVRGLWVDPTRALGVGQGANFFARTGGSWPSTVLSASDSVQLYDVWVSADGGLGVVVAEQGRVFESTDPANANTYALARTMSGGDELHAVWGSSTSDLWAAGGSSVVLHRNGSGTWEPAEFDAGANISDIDGVSAVRAWMVGSGGANFRHTSDGGWAPQAPMPGGHDTRGVWVPATGPIDAFAVGASIYVHTEASGWTPSQAPAHADLLHAVWGFAPDDVYAVGDWGTVLHFDGSKWTALESGTRKALYSVKGRLVDGHKELFIGGEAGTILRKLVP